jgi:hypothetical protein
MRVQRYKTLLSARVQARPFRPFTIKVENGERYRITHPENVVWGKDGYTMVYVGNELRAFLDASAITAVEAPRNAGRAS